MTGETKPTHHYGRGGAGNVTTKDAKSPVIPPSLTPTLKSKNYTTGRGGQGNIVENTNPETARRAQDVDVPGIVLPENEYHTGRGGVGNLVKPTDEEVAANKQHNRDTHAASLNKDKSGLKGLAEKAKGIISHKE